MRCHTLVYFGETTSNLSELRYQATPNLTRKQARATKQQGQGKLADQLAAQKKGGMQAALKDASYENQRQREADASQEARNWS